MEAKKHHSMLIRILFVISALLLLSVAVNAQSPVTKSKVPVHKKAAVDRQVSLTDYSLLSIDTVMQDTKVLTNAIANYEAANGTYIYQSKLLLDSVNRINHLLNYTLQVVSSNTGTAYGGAYYSISSSSAAVTSPTVQVTNGDYEIVSCDLVTVGSASALKPMLSILVNTISIPADNTSFVYTENDLLSNIACIIYFPSIIYAAATTWLWDGVMNTNGVTVPVAIKRNVRVVNGYLAFALNTIAAGTPSSGAKYDIKLTLRRIR